jgi:hypothetical protein
VVELLVTVEVEAEPVGAERLTETVKAGVPLVASVGAPIIGSEHRMPVTS